MKQLMAAVLILLCCNGYAQDWDTYMAKFGKKPGSVLVDMSLMDKAPDKKYPYLVITGPQGRNCDADGIPAKEEIDVLEDILGATGNFITGVTAKILTGTFTYDCERLNYYYVKDTIGIRTAIQRMYEHSYKNYSFALNMKYDPAWLTYKTFLYPGDQMQNWMQNTKIITAMIKAGDSLKAKHVINFEFYFNSDTGRKAFADHFIAQGYTVARQNQTTRPPITYGLVMAREDKIDLDDMNKTTTGLGEEAHKHGGTLQGWNAKRIIN